MASGSTHNLWVTISNSTSLSLSFLLSKNGVGRAILSEYYLRLGGLMLVMSDS